MKKVFTAFLAVIMCVLAVGCSGTKKDNKIVIYSSMEDYRNEYMRNRLKEQFKDYEIDIQYMTSGTHAAKLLSEGTASPCDITIDLEYGYIDKLRSVLADLSEYDTSVFVDDMVDPGKNVLPEYKNGGCIAINTQKLKALGLAEPTSYDDLLKPEYKNLVSMPNPKSSGTGYMFLKSLVNAWGEEKAFTYFDKLSENILQYTSSGSGPVNALVQGEAAIGLAMTAQAVTEINKGASLKILFFEEGSPYTSYGVGIIKGKENKKAVKEVFDFINSTLVAEDKERFFPEKIYKDKDFQIPNFPTDIKYADMKNNTGAEKDRLLEKWNH